MASTSISSNPAARPCIFSSEGSIAAEKTSILHALQGARPAWSFFAEPLAVWEADNLLENFYKYPNAFYDQFQQRIFASYTPIQSRAKQFSRQPVIIERGTRSAAQVFSALGYYLQYLTAAQYQDILDTYEINGYLDFDRQVNYIYIDSSPAVCYQRMRQRNRRAEASTISLQYLTDLDSFYRREFLRPTTIFKPTIVIENPELSLEDKVRQTTAVIEAVLQQQHGI